VSNSTYAELFRDEFPERYFEMYIAEQNMVGAALGSALRGKLPFVSTFAAFLTRAFRSDSDELSFRCHSEIRRVPCGGLDRPGRSSQMGLEDLAMFRTVPDSVVLCPCDAISTERLWKR